MSGLYGSWLAPTEFDFNPIKQHIENAHAEDFPKFLGRVDAILGIAELVKGELVAQYPVLTDVIHVSYTAIVSAVGRYVNDISHYKIWHGVKKANVAKMISHTIKWLSLHHGLVCNITADQYGKLGKTEKLIVLELNSIFINTVIRYFLSYFSQGETPSSKEYQGVFYLLDTGQFDAKTAAMTFEGILN